MQNFYFYRAHGLDIKSIIKFPELIPGNGNNNVVIHFEGHEFLNDLQPLEKNNGLYKFVNNVYDITYFFDDIPFFNIKNGTEIILNPEIFSESKFSLPYIRSLILGVGFGVLLMQQGHLVLHASAVNVNGNAIAFLGNSGSGKSTMATFLSKKGYPLITDDVLVSKMDEKYQPFVVPSFPKVKIWADTIEFLDENNDKIQIHPEIKKYFYGVHNYSKLELMPLKVIYIIEDSIKNEIVLLKHQDALISVLKNMYCINILDNDTYRKSIDFFQCVDLIKNVPVKSLRMIKTFESMETLSKLIEEDINCII